MKAKRKKQNHNEVLSWTVIDRWVEDVGFPGIELKFRSEKRWFNHYRLQASCSVEDFFDLVHCKGGDCAN